MGDPPAHRYRAPVGTDDIGRRPWPRSVAVGLFAALGGFSIGLIAIALPLYGLARALEAGRGLNRPFIRDNLTQLVLPVSCLCALAAGVLVGRWYRRGGRLPDGE